MKRAVALLLALALVLGAASVVALLAIGSGDDAAQPHTSAGDPDATQAPSPALARYYSQELDWKSCRDGDFCSTLTVPLDYHEPAGQTIDLALLMVPAADRDQRAGALVVNPGGPGAPGTDYAANAAAVFRKPITDAYDVVGFDPRGTGASAPVDCLTDDELDAYLAEDPDPDTDAERAEYDHWVDALGAGCAQRSGEVAGHVTTVEAARDMDVLRAALGETELDYFGASYGTKLGATYADLFPDRVGRFVLDGALDPELSARELSLGQAQGFETALRAYVDDCVDQSDCPLGDSLDAGLARIKDFLAGVDAEPLDTGTDRKLKIGNAFYGIVLPLYSRSSWSYLTQALRAAFNGDGSLLLRFSDIYASRGSSGYTDNSMEANYAINCLDDPWSITPDEVADNLADFEKASPTFGSVFAWGLTTCAGIQEKATEEAPKIDAVGAAPIVVIGTTRDPATPYAWAKSLAAELDSGVLVSRDGDGHTGYNSGNACVDEAVEDYLVDGTVPDDGLSC
jgi:pimeloyl-ACP methyl ester carboxylesterase